MKKMALCVLSAMIAMSAFGQGDDAAARKKLLEVAFKYRGVPYVYGSESPKAFDCSGFVRYVYREAYGIELPRSAREFYSAGSAIDWKAAKPGDVFVYDTVGGAPSHVSLFVGDGTVIHAVSDGPVTGVIVSPLTDRYWSPRLIAARTFFRAAQGAPKPAPPIAAAPKPSAPQTTAQKATAPQTAETAKPSPAAKAAPAPTSAPQAKAERVIADIGVVIPPSKASFTDKIPTAAGTSVAFTLTNGTGKDGSFMVLFFSVDPRTYKLRQIHEEKVKLAAKAAHSLPPYGFDEAGKYKLVVKDSWGNQLFEREFVVTE